MKRDFIKSIFLVSSILIALLLAELFLEFFWSQKNIYLYEYKDGYVYNRPDFDYVFSFLPRRLPKEFRDLRTFIDIGLTEEEKIKMDEIIGERRRDQLSREIATNASGQRDDINHNYEKTDKFRVLNLGDSIGFGWPVNLDDSYVKVIEKQNKKVEVINCSFINANTPMLLEFYKKDCSRYNPDLVILQMTISKEGNNPDFLFLDKFGPDFIEANIIASVYGMEYLEGIVGRDEEGGPKIQGSMEGLSELINKRLSPRVNFYNNLNIIRLIENLLVDVNGRSINFSGLKEAFRIDDGDSPMLSFRYIEELKNEVEKDDARLLIIIVPNLDGFYFSKIKEVKDWKKLKDVLSENDYAVLDFLEIFNNYNPDEIYVKNEFHPNENGYRIIGEELVKAIENNFLILEDGNTQ